MQSLTSHLISVACHLHSTACLHSYWESWHFFILLDMFLILLNLFSHLPVIPLFLFWHWNSVPLFPSSMSSYLCIPYSMLLCYPVRTIISYISVLTYSLKVVLFCKHKFWYIQCFIPGPYSVVQCILFIILFLWIWIWLRYGWNFVLFIELGWLLVQNIILYVFGGWLQFLMNILADVSAMQPWKPSVIFHKIECLRHNCPNEHWPTSSPCHTIYWEHSS